MKMNNEQMLDSLAVLSKLENEKGMLGYAIARNRKKILMEVQEYSAKRDELLKKHGKDIGNGQFRLDPENAAEYFKDLQPFSELTVDVAVMQVDPEVFFGGNLTSSEMYILCWMVKED